jgi:uncharacterized membrane protein YqjE
MVDRTAADPGALATLLDIAQTRLALAVTELEEERLRLAHQALRLLATVCCATLGAACAPFAYALQAPEPERPLRLAWMAAGFVAVAALAAFAWVRSGGSRTPLLQATFTEFRKDCAGLTARPPA